MRSDRPTVPLRAVLPPGLPVLRPWREVVEDNARACAGDREAVLPRALTGAERALGWVRAAARRAAAWWRGEGR